MSLGALVVTVTALGAATSSTLEPAASTSPRPIVENRYIGAKKCKSCHKSDDMGNQYAAWENAGHSKAFDVLASDEAKKLAGERGIADPQKHDGCVKCHTTAFGVDEALIKKGFDHEAGVQCETCHGPGEEHMKARFAAAAKKEAEPVIGEGEIILSPGKATCVGCHNEEAPNFESFCFHSGMLSIAHPRPGHRAELISKMQECSSCHSEGAALASPQPALCTTCHDPVPEMK